LPSTGFLASLIAEKQVDRKQPQEVQQSQTLSEKEEKQKTNFSPTLTPSRFISFSPPPNSCLTSPKGKEKKKLLNRFRALFALLKEG
jgi:hypothetical protein